MLIVRDAKKEEWEEIMGLAWRTYLKFEAGEYSTEGTNSFFAFITNSNLYKLFLTGKYIVKVAEQDEQLVGMISMRNGNHLSLLFVEKSYHKQGIGRKLIDEMCLHLKKENIYDALTVNAAPSAVSFYQKLDFEQVSELKETDGIVYLPMKKKIPRI